MTTVVACCCASWIGELARAHTRRLLAVARREGLRGDDALDAVQDGLAVLLAHPARDELRDDAKAAGRLLTVMVRNAARNLRRRHHRAAPHRALADDDAVATEAGPDVAVSAADEVTRLVGCVAGLSELHRQVIALRVLEEISGEDAAARLGLRPGHVAVLLHRARVQLAACLAG